MQIFKYYFKIAKSFLPTIIMYVTIFMFFAVFATTQSKSENVFVTAKPNVVIVNHDDSIFSAGFVEYIKKEANVVDIKDTEEARKEAIYFQTIDYVYIIPDGFGDDFFANKIPQLTTLQVYGSSAEQARMLGENYLRLAKPRLIAGMSQTYTVSGITNDLAVTNTKVEIQNNIDNVGSSKAQFFYNFASYIILALCIMIISMIMVTFTSKNIKRRNTISPLPYGNVTSQLFFGNFVFMFVIWGIFVTASCVLYPEIMFTLNGAMYLLNSFIFSLVGLSIGFMIGNFVKSKNAIGGITNVIALGSSFICGVFVPQQYLGDSVLNIARFIPTYWYVKTNELIYSLTDFNSSSVKPVFINMAIVFGFAVAIFTVTYVIGYIKRKESI